MFGSLSKSLVFLGGMLILSGCRTAEFPEEISRDQRYQNSKEGRVLHAKISMERPDTYAGSYLTDWMRCNCRVFLFTEAAEQTLTQYTDNPSFSAKQVKYSLQELNTARDLTVQLVKNSIYLPSSVHVSVDESLNLVSLFIHDDNPNVSKELVALRSKLHPSVAILYPEDVGVVEVY